MSLAEKITEDVKSALKGGDKKKLSIARYLSSELKNYLIKENLDRELSNLTDESFYKIVKTQVKQKKESLEFAEKSSDPEKVEEIKYDINYLNSYLPQLMSEDDTKKIIENYIKNKDFTSTDFGKIMGHLKKDYNNQIDLTLASKLIKGYFNE
ncbi:MAG: GatB/YqeY domain-containing protein [Alphaproteobacteria bacterium]|nr:GatB/YqeY domain-containing protein [Alphaproteobacteria bacterium]